MCVGGMMREHREALGGQDAFVELMLCVTGKWGSGSDRAVIIMPLAKGPACGKVGSSFLQIIFMWRWRMRELLSMRPLWIGPPLLPGHISINTKAGQRKPFRGLTLKPVKAHEDGPRSLKYFFCS